MQLKCAWLSSTVRTGCFRHHTMAPCDPAFIWLQQQATCCSLQHVSLVLIHVGFLIQQLLLLFPLPISFDVWWQNDCWSGEALCTYMVPCFSVVLLNSHTTFLPLLSSCHKYPKWAILSQKFHANVVRTLWCDSYGCSNLAQNLPIDCAFEWCAQTYQFSVISSENLHFCVSN